MRSSYKVQVYFIESKVDTIMEKVSMTDTDVGHCYNKGFEHLMLAGTIADNTRDAINATNRIGVAGIKETGDVGRDNIRETSRVGTDLSHDIFHTQHANSQYHSDSRSAIERTSAEGRLQSAMMSRDILLSQANLAVELRGDIKDVNVSVLKESCKTREKTAEQYSSLQLQICKDHAKLAAKIAECCCEQKQLHAETKALVLAMDAKRTETDNANLRQELMIAKLSQRGNGNGNGNSN